ncbi:transposase [Dankookia sp. GCM10030260]|uniref:transposase n=1 Tax=Dankookia sp. GCM10030260 TaxID=3273390 RepID=UPI00361B0BE4
MAPATACSPTRPSHRSWSRRQRKVRGVARAILTAAPASNVPPAAVSAACSCRSTRCTVSAGIAPFLRRADVVESRPPRRRGDGREYTAEQRAQILTEAALPGARVLVVAQRHGISPSLVYRWQRRDLSPDPTYRAEDVPAVGDS